jgi:hypothetical protein
MTPRMLLESLSPSTDWSILELRANKRGAEKLSRRPRTRKRKFVAILGGSIAKYNAKCAAQAD